MESILAQQWISQLLVVSVFAYPHHHQSVWASSSQSWNACDFGTKDQESNSFRVSSFQWHMEKVFEHPWASRAVMPVRLWQTKDHESWHFWKFYVQYSFLIFTLFRLKNFCFFLSWTDSLIFLLLWTDSVSFFSSHEQILLAFPPHEQILWIFSPHEQIL